MPDPADLLDVARLLAAAPPDASDARLRRAISTAYYAVFHKILRLAAERFVGEAQRHTAAYRLPYRGFDHGRVYEVCQAVDKPMMNKIFREALGRTAVSEELRGFAFAFRELRDARQFADYDPAQRLTIIAVNEIIQIAEAAMDVLDQVDLEELADVLALMMVKTRI